jgi:hypothetical protein
MDGYLEVVWIGRVEATHKGRVHLPGVTRRRLRPIEPEPLGFRGKTQRLDLTGFKETPLQKASVVFPAEPDCENDGVSEGVGHVPTPCGLQR